MLLSRMTWHKEFNQDGHNKYKFEKFYSISMSKNSHYKSNTLGLWYPLYGLLYPGKNYLILSSALYGSRFLNERDAAEAIFMRIIN